MNESDKSKGAPWYAHVGEGVSEGGLPQHSVCSGTGPDRGDENDHACVAMAYGRDEVDARAVAQRIADDHNEVDALRAEVERLTREVACLDAAAVGARDDAREALAARDAAESALRSVWDAVAPEEAIFPRVAQGDDEAADGATIAARAASLRAERDAARRALAQAIETREWTEARAWEALGLTQPADATALDLAARIRRAVEDRDALRPLLGAAARGELPRCDECPHAATLHAATTAGEFYRCDVHAGADEWETLPHAAALRAAMATKESGR